jgi:uncharacterized protein
VLSRLDFEQNSGDEQRKKNMSDQSTIQTLQRVLSAYKTIAVVGLSGDWNRPSYFAAKYMQEHGFRVIPVNPKYTEILGQVCYPSLLQIPKALAATVGIVDCFRKSEDILSVAQEAVQIGAKCLWQQLGVMNAQAHTLALSAGMDSIMDRCVKIEHARLFGGLGWVGVNTQIVTAKKFSLGHKYFGSKHD